MSIKKIIWNFCISKNEPWPRHPISFLQWQYHVYEKSELQFYKQHVKWQKCWLMGALTNEGMKRAGNHLSEQSSSTHPHILLPTLPNWFHILFQQDFSYTVIPDFSSCRSCIFNKCLYNNPPILLPISRIFWFLKQLPRLPWISLYLSISWYCIMHK